MPTPAPPALPALPALPAVPRLPWRGLALLAAAVLLAHLALLLLAPMAPGPRPSPLADKFITRTIVIAPPSTGAPAAPPPAAAAAPAPPKPVRPRPAPRPRPRPAVAPAPEPQPESVAVPDPTAQDLIARNTVDPDAATPPETSASAPASGGPGAGAASGAGTASAPGGGAAAGNIEGPAALRIPGSVRLSFAATAQIGASPMQGVFGDLVWRQDGTHYDASLSWNFLFKTLRSQHSSGAIGPTGIEPLRYADTRKTEVASHFVRDQGQVVFSNNTPSVMLLAGAQDRLSVVLQLGALMAGDPARYPPGAVIAVQTVGTSDAEIWTFNVGGEEELSVPGGDFTTRKLTRNPRKPFDDKIELWLAPALGWLPVRIKQTQPNGDFFDLQMRNQVALRPQN